jgi:hypothetical protein
VSALQADFLSIPLLDGSRALAQVFEVEDRGLFTGLTGQKLAEGQSPSPCPQSDFVALVFTTPDAIVSGLWMIPGFDQLPPLAGMVDYPGQRALDFPDYPVHDPAVIEAYLNALHGLYDWTAFGDLFDRMTRPGVVRP